MADGGTITRGGEGTDILVCVHKADATFYYDEEVQTLVHTAYTRCETILRDQREQLDTVARYLLEHETMEREAFLAVFGEADTPTA